MIQFLFYAVVLIGGGALLEGCHKKNEPSKEKTTDQFSSLPRNPGDLTWAAGRLQNYCKQFKNINLDSICTPKNDDNQKPASCIRNPTPEKILDIANGWNALREYERMIHSACFAFQADNEKAGYQILAAAFNNRSNQNSSNDLLDTLAASEKALELSPTDNEFKKLAAINNGLAGDAAFSKKDYAQAKLFYGRAVKLHETIPSQIGNREEDFNHQLKYYSHLSFIALRENDLDQAKKYLIAAFALFSLLPAQSLTDLLVFDEFVEVYKEALKKNPPPVIVNEIEANWESIGRAYLNFAGRKCKDSKNILSKANEAFRLAGKENKYSNLIKSTCNPHN